MSLNSVIMTKIRPTVIFDPENPDHRRHAWIMIKNRSLKDCPYIWALHEGHDNVFDMIHQKLVVWYTEQEFAAAATKPQRRVVDIKTVDKRA
jgi:hypothetical protein